MTLSLSGSPWPATTGRGADGSLVIGGASAKDLAAEFGTPAYLLDEGEFRTRARTIRSIFGEAFARLGTEVDVFYASKALLIKAIAKWANEEGLFVDTASGGEMAVALAAGVDGSRLALHGNNKSDAELVAALEHGIGRIIIDSFQEIERLAALAGQRGVVAPVMLRVATGVHAGGHEYIRTAHEDQKFGLSITAGLDGGDAPAICALLRILELPSLRLLGLHCHIGSQILDIGGFAESARALMRVRAHLAQRTGHLMGEVDLGGGFGIAYLPGERDLDLHQTAQAIADAVEHACAELETPVPRISIEPGRSIVGRAGVTLYTVGTVKPVLVDDEHGAFTRLYVSVDGGMSDNIRPSLYQAVFHAEIASRFSTAPLTRVRVVGKHCETGDILVRDLLLPDDVAPGDLLAVAATGAYGRSMASNYNLLTKPPVIGVRDGQARVLVRRETIDDLLALDQG